LSKDDIRKIVNTTADLIKMDVVKAVAYKNLKMVWSEKWLYPFFKTTYKLKFGTSYSNMVNMVMNDIHINI
jgi:hypothetical protein